MKEDKLNTNWQVEKKIRKIKDLSCSRCPPNKKENTKRGNQYHAKHKSWKFRTKKNKQFEGKGAQ